MTRKDYKNLDDAICQFLATKDGHPTNSSTLLELAGTRDSGSYDWRLIDRRMVAMRKAGRIKFVGNGKNNPSGKTHGWVVCVPDPLVVNLTSMTELSPAARAVLDAAEDDCIHPADLHKIVAAALEAAADQVVPDAPDPAAIMGPVFVAEVKKQLKIRSALLSIAAELKAHA